MRWYILKLPKKFLALMLFFILIGGWVNFKTKKAMPTMSQYEPIYEGKKNKKMMAFTCNVAWGNEYIPKLLNIFDEKNIKITFFIEGRWADNFPEILKLIHSKGHEIGNHGYSHAHHSQLSLEQNSEEIRKAAEAIEKVTNDKLTLFAPPYGEFSEETIKAANNLNYKLIMWSIDTIDWKKPGVQYIVNKVLENAGNGKIVLMHPTEETVRALPTIIDNLHREGYRITTVSEILK